MKNKLQYVNFTFITFDSIYSTRYMYFGNSDFILAIVKLDL